MKENVLDVLMYLFETYVDTEEDPEPDHNELRNELSRAGFADLEIERALDWLDGLTDQQDSLGYGSEIARGTRIYSDFRRWFLPDDGRLGSCRYYGNSFGHCKRATTGPCNRTSHTYGTGRSFVLCPGRSR